MTIPVGIPYLSLRISGLYLLRHRPSIPWFTSSLKIVRLLLGFSSSTT